MTGLIKDAVEEDVNMKTKWTGLLAFVLILVLLASCAKPVERMTATELLLAGENYLLELDYEQAVLCFERLIQLEPKNQRGYTGLAEAYVGLDMQQKAVRVLREGLVQLPDNPAIKDMLDMLSGAGSSAGSAGAGAGDAVPGAVLPTSITSWVLEPSIIADELVPGIMPYHYTVLHNPRENVARSVDWGGIASGQSLLAVSRVMVNGKWGLIDFAGNIVVPAKYNSIYYTGRESSPIWAYMVDDYTYDTWGWLDSNYAFFPLDGGWGEEGSYLLLWNTFDETIYRTFHLGSIEFEEPLRTDTLMPVQEIHMDLSKLERGVYYPVEEINYWDGSHKFGYATGDRLVLPFEFEMAQVSQEGIVAARKSGRWYYYDNDGLCLTPEGYDAVFDNSNVFNGNARELAYDFSDGLAAVNKNGLWGYIDSNGTEVIACQYEATRPLYSGVAWVKVDGRWGLADLTAYTPAADAPPAGVEGKAIFGPDTVFEAAQPSVTLAELNLRKGPGTEYEPMLVIPKGVTVKKRGTANGKVDWVYASYNGILGWVNTEWVQ